MITFNLLELNQKKPLVQTTQLLSEIDDVLVCLASRKRDNIRYGASFSVNYYDYEELTILRKILINKTCGDSCLSLYNLADIIALIRRLLYKFCR